MTWKQKGLGRGQMAHHSITKNGTTVNPTTGAVEKTVEDSTRPLMIPLGTMQVVDRKFLISVDIQVRKNHPLNLNL